MSAVDPHATIADRAHAAALDAADPLAPFQARFAPVPPGLIYLDGNSLGRLPQGHTPTRIAKAIEHEWGQRLIRGWDEGWMALPQTVGDRLGEQPARRGTRPGAAGRLDDRLLLQARRRRAAGPARTAARSSPTRANFPTDRYVLEGLAAQHDRELVWTTPG